MPYLDFVLNAKLSDDDRKVVQWLIEELSGIRHFDGRTEMIAAIQAAIAGGALEESAAVMEIVNWQLMRVVHRDQKPGPYRNIRTGDLLKNDGRDIELPRSSVYSLFVIDLALVRNAC